MDVGKVVCSILWRRELLPLSGVSYGVQIRGVVARSVQEARDRNLGSRAM